MVRNVCTAKRDEFSPRRSLLHGQDKGHTRDHRSIIEQWLAVGGGWWRLVVGGGQQLEVGGLWQLAVGGGRQMAVGGW